MNYITFIACVILTCVQIAFSAPEHRLVIDPRLPFSDVKTLIADIRTSIMEPDIEEGESIVAYDGSTGVPEAHYLFQALDYDTPRSRVRTLRDFERDLLKWSKRASRQDGPGLMIPDVLETVAVGASENTRIYFIGNTVYEHSGDPSFSFRQPEGIVTPELDKLELSPGVHPFGCLGRAIKPGVSAFIINVFEEPVDSRNLVKMERLYRKFFEVQKMNGLSYYGPSNSRLLTGLFDLAIGPTERIETVDSRIIESAGEELPLVFERVEPVRVLASGVQVSNEAEQVLNDSEIEVLEAFSANADGGTASVGIIWDDAVDIDLYVFDGNSRPIFYGNKSNRFAEYQKDIRRGSGSWEQIVLSEVPAGLKAFVNFYSGNVAEEIRGKLMTKVGNSVRVVTFKLSAGKGNMGKGWDQRHSMPEWVELDLSPLYL